MYLAQFSPVTSLALPVIESVKADIVAWGVVFIGVALTVYAYNRIYDIVAEREHQREEDEERDEQIEAYHPANGAEPDYDYDFKYKD